jgi:hypothetical protein
MYRKTILLLATLLGLQQAVSAQFYYQDILNTARTEANMALLKQNKVTVQIVQSFDANQETDNDFKCRRELSDNYRHMRSVTNSPATGYSVMSSYFSAKGRLTKIVDSSRDVITTSIYERNTNDTSGKITEVYFVTQDTKNKYKFTETRRYIYDSVGNLKRMIHFHGDRVEDSSTVTFTIDSTGKVADELETGVGLHSNKLYYRYNDQGFLTDILRYSPSRQKMLPDYMFDYDANDRLGSMTTINGETSDYTIWRYTYTEEGLPLQEECYGKQKVLLGTVKYAYRH